MHQFGVSLKHRFDRSVEYFAPGKVTPVPMVLVHRGDSTKSMTVELEVLTNLGRRDGYDRRGYDGFDRRGGGYDGNNLVL